MERAPRAILYSGGWSEVSTGTLRFSALSRRALLLLASQELCMVLLEHSAGKTKYTKDTFKKVWELELAALCHTVILLQEITAVTLDPLQTFLYLSLSGCEMCISLSGEDSPTNTRGISHLARWEMKSLLLNTERCPWTCSIFCLRKVSVSCFHGLMFHVEVTQLAGNLSRHFYNL